jgi:hypothetical protein
LTTECLYVFCVIPKTGRVYFINIIKRVFLLFFLMLCTRCIGKFPDSYCCNCLGERRWEGMPRSHLRKPIASVCHVTARCEQALLLHECFFDFVFLSSTMDGKLEKRVSIKFCAKLGESATETLGMLREAFGQHSFSRTAVFEWHSHFKACRVSVEDDECSWEQAPTKR